MSRLLCRYTKREYQEKANVDLNKCGLQINRCKYASYKLLQTTIRPNKSVDDVEIVVASKSGMEIKMTQRWMDRSFYKPFGVYYLCRGAWCITNIYVHVVSVEYYSL